MDAEIPEQLYDNIASSPEMIGKYFKHRQIYLAAFKEVTTKLEILDEEFRISHEYNPIHHIESRLKTPKSILKKLEWKQVAFTEETMLEHVQDIAGVQVICNYIEDIYTIADLLIKQSDIALLCKRDYISHPKETTHSLLHWCKERLGAALYRASRTAAHHRQTQIGRGH